jgi:uncharacterized membrane protein YkgB
VPHPAKNSLSQYPEQEGQYGDMLFSSDPTDHTSNAMRAIRPQGENSATVRLRRNNSKRRYPMNQLTTKFEATTGESNRTRLPAPPSLMDSLARVLVRLGILTEDLDYHLIRASMVIIFLFFGYQKWFQYEADVLIPYISNGPSYFWLYPVFGVRGATWFLGVSEWTFGTLLFLGFWNKKLGILGALGSCVTFICTATIIPFMPNGWAASAGGFPAMTEHVAFLMKDIVLFSVSFYLLRQDVMRASLSAKQNREAGTWVPSR